MKITSSVAVHRLQATTYIRPNHAIDISILPALTHLEQLAGTQGDIDLQSVQPVAVGRGPAAPDVGCFAHCAVAAAGHVAQDAVELQGATLTIHSTLYHIDTWITSATVQHEHKTQSSG